VRIVHRVAAALRRRAGDGQRGSVSLYVLLTVPALLAAAGLVFDGGSATAAKARATGDAYAAARAGAQALSRAAYAATGTIRADPTAAQAAALTYLRRSGDADGAHVSVAGRKVDVSVTVATDTRLLDAFGVPQITVTGTGSATAVYATAERHP
jgi:hypothetical protein